MRQDPLGAAFDAVDSRLFFSRGDTEDPRLGDMARALPPPSSKDGFAATLEEAVALGDKGTRHVVLAGYPDDEGIRINGGRPGAAHAPSEVRRSLYKMTPPLFARRPGKLALWDAGDLRTASGELSIRHESIRTLASVALNAGAQWVGIGGGHDYGYADAAAFGDWCKASGAGRPLVINFDAHLDVRPTTRGLSSGTPFFRMFEKLGEVDFAEIGIQAHCNSRSHLEWVRARGARVLTQEELEASGEPMVTAVTRVLGDWLLRPRPVFLSIDIDGFSSAVAPGCSQSWATGFMPEAFFPCLDMLSARLDVKSLGIYEVSPPLDHDMRTAKLAAQIIHRVIA